MHGFGDLKGTLQAESAFEENANDFGHSLEFPVSQNLRAADFCRVFDADS